MAADIDNERDRQLTLTVGLLAAECAAALARNGAFEGGSKEIADLVGEIVTSCVEAADPARAKEFALLASVIRDAPKEQPQP